MITVSVALLLVAFILFALVAFNVPSGPVNLSAVAFALCTLAFLWSHLRV